MYMEEGIPPYNISREALIGGYNGSVINLLPAMIYSVSSLVVPKMEEGISGTGAVKNSK